MERPNFMSKSATPAPAGDTGLFDGVEFPIAPDFISHLPSIDLETMYLASEKFLPKALAAGDRTRDHVDFPEFIL